MRLPNSVPFVEAKSTPLKMNLFPNILGCFFTSYWIWATMVSCICYISSTFDLVTLDIMSFRKADDDLYTNS